MRNKLHAYHTKRVAVVLAIVLVASGITIIGHQITTRPSDINSATTSPRVFYTHADIVTTIFWVGEPADSDNGNINNQASAWDETWQSSFGGFDDPISRDGYRPAAFVPKENSFYIALPYNDIENDIRKGPGSKTCQELTGTNGSTSWCKNAWISVKYGTKTVYGQWQDAGPFGENDYNYVFGNAKPKNTEGEKAGLDVSPAIRDYLGLDDVSKTSWHFIAEKDVPAGPWKQTITTSPGFRL